MQHHQHVDPLNDAAEGLLKVVDGIESESRVDIFTSSLDIVAAIAMFGGPYGAGASTVFSFTSTGITLFGGTSGKILINHSIVCCKLP